MYERSEVVELSGSTWKARPVVAWFGATSSNASRRFVLVHGNPSNISEWEHTISALRVLGEVLAIDMPGFGRSEPLLGAVPTLNNFAEVIARLAQTRGWTQVDIVGQSHGGLVGHTVAARHPELVRSVVLLGTGGTPAHLSYRLLPLPGVKTLLGSATSAGLVSSRAFRPLLRRVVEHSARSVFAPDLVPRGFVEAQVKELVERPHILRTMVEVSLDGPCVQVARQASRVQAPCLFVHGRGDELVPIEYARRLCALTSATCATRFVALGGGHMVHLARPSVVNPLLISWLRELA
ncbi:MAG: pimeloyl-ACP methyl ester carboxylesterase [Polyangiales bacterium]|jgi:pimeloyl-ACP methyl ester carboxylesterase